MAKKHSQQPLHAADQEFEDPAAEIRRREAVADPDHRLDYAHTERQKHDKPLDQASLREFQIEQWKKSTRNVVDLLKEAGVDLQTIQDLAKTNFDPEAVQEAGIESALAQQIDKTRSIIHDGGGKDISYAGLNRVFMPLILDIVGQEPWTVEEIIKAMGPAAKNIARRLGSLKGSFSFEDAESVAYEFLLRSLATDAGKSPFARYAFRAMLKGASAAAKRTSLIKSKATGHTYHDPNVRIDKDAPEGGSMAGELTDMGAPDVIQCPTCKGSGKVEDEEDGEVFACPQCGGTGSLVSRVERGEQAPDVAAQETERRKKFKNIVTRLIKATNLTRRQMEALLLTYGIEDVYDSGLIATALEEGDPGKPKLREATAIARILGIADTIHKTRDTPQGPVSTGLWAKAQDLGKTHEFIEVWNQYLKGTIEFDPDVPTSLQISPLYDESLEALNNLVNDLGEAIGVEPPSERERSLSKQLVVNLFKSIHAGFQELQTRDPELIKKAMDEMRVYRECIEYLNNQYIQFIVERINTANADEEDIMILESML